MLGIQQVSEFRRDVKRLIRSGKDVSKLETIVTLLVEEKVLPDHYKNHPLKGAYKGYFDCHIEPDWVMIYKIDRINSCLILVRTGSHSQIF
jgi:mRNA interferase YafQ